MINVQTAGAKGDDTTFDNSTVLNNLIASGDGALYFPPGRYRINETLTFPAETGHHWVGCGMAPKAHSSLTGARAAIYWGGDDGGTMIKYGGSGLVWDALSLWGRISDSGNRAAVAIEIKQPSAGSPVTAGKIWFPAILIEDCGTGVYADGTIGASSCAFGFYQPRKCDIALELNGTGATMFTVRSLLASGGPQHTRTVFKAINGGRIYAESVNILAGVDKVLDVVGGDIDNGFYQIDGLTVDGGNLDVTLLNNDDDSNGLTYVRFTNMQFAKNKDTTPKARINIDRSSSTSGQTVIELVGCRGVTLDGTRMFQKVTIKGASASTPSRLVVRDCELAGTPTTNALIDPDVLNPSSNYSENRIKNWVFNAGLQSDSSGP